MSLTYKDAKNLLSQYAGRGGTCLYSDSVDSFIREVFEYLLISGASPQDVRKFTFIAQKGVFTVPFEVDAILKVKVDNHVGSVWDKWFEFRDTQNIGGDCIPADDALFEEPNYYSTAYDVPSGGSQIATLGICTEDPDAHVIVQGKDITGREIFTVHKGERISGEYLSIEKGSKKYTTSKFASITGVTKSKTNGYVQLLWINPVSGQYGFLSDYSPLEEVPSYRRYKLTNANYNSCSKVTILARIRLKEAYSDNDRIPFETLLTLRLAAQSVNAEYNNDIQTAQAKDARMNTLIEKENQRNRPQNGKPISFSYYTSPGLIKNIIGRIGWIGFRR